MRDKKGWWDIIKPKVRRKPSSQKSIMTDDEAEDFEIPEEDQEDDLAGAWPNEKELDKASEAGTRKSKKSDKSHKPSPKPVKYTKSETTGMLGRKLYQTTQSQRKLCLGPKPRSLSKSS